MIGKEVEIGDEGSTQGGQQSAQFVNLADEDMQDEEEKKQCGGRVKQGGGSNNDSSTEKSGFADRRGALVADV